MYTNLCGGVLTVVSFHKSCDKCFERSGPLLQIRSVNPLLSQLTFLSNY